MSEFASKRKKVTDFIVARIGKIIPEDKENPRLMREKLERLTDAQFKDYISRLKPVKTQEDLARREFLPYYIPNLGKHRISVARNYKLTRELGRSLAHRLIMQDASTGLTYITPHPYPCYDLAIRRQSQTGQKKRSIPTGDQRIDDMSGQPMAMSKGARVSGVELGTMISRNHIKSALELVNIRGGNEEGYREMRKRIIETGDCTLDELEGVGKVKSIMTLSMLFNCMGIGNNIDPDTRVPEDAKK